MRQIAASLALGAALLMAFPGQGRAASYVAQDVWYSTLYGAAIGSVAGAGVMLVSDPDDPFENAEYIVTGAGVGILAGMFYGIYSASTHQAALDNGGAVAAFDADGETHFQMPLVRPYLAKSGHGGEVAGVGMHVNLVHGRF